MSTVTISGLTAATAAAATDLFVGQIGGVTKKITTQNTEKAFGGYRRYYPVFGLTANDSTAAAANTVLIQAAINAGVAGGLVDVFLAGDIYVSTGQDGTAQAMPYPPCLYINGSNITIRLGDATVLKVAPGQNQYPILAAMGSTNAHLSRITISGGEINGNATNQTFTTDGIILNLIDLWHIDDLRVENTKLWSGSGNPQNNKFIVDAFDLQRPVFQNCFVVNHSDGLHLEGPLSDVLVAGCKITTEDAAIALGIMGHGAAYEPYLHPGAVYAGNVTGVQITDTFIGGPVGVQMFRLGTENTSYSITNININGIVQNYTGGSIGVLVDFGEFEAGDGAAATVSIDRVTVSNVLGQGTIFAYFDEGGHVGKVSFTNVDWKNASTYDGHVVSVLPTHTVDRICCNNARLTNVKSGQVTMNISGTITEFDFSNGLLATTDTGLIIRAGNGGMGIVRGNFRNVEFSGGGNTGGGYAVFRTSTSSAYWTATDIYCHDVPAAWVENGAGTPWNLTLDGDQRYVNTGIIAASLHTGSTITIGGNCRYYVEGTGGSAVYADPGKIAVNNPGFQCHIGDLTPALFDRVYNTDAGQGIGVGPAICSNAGTITWSKNGRP